MNLYATRGKALENLEWSVEHFINGGSIVPHLIPAYSEERIAFAKARRHKANGARHVRIAVVDVRKLSRKKQHRSLLSLAAEFDISHPRLDRDEAKFEYVFSHHISLCAVQVVRRV